MTTLYPLYPVERRGWRNLPEQAQIDAVKNALSGLVILYDGSCDFDYVARKVIVALKEKP